MNTTRQNKETPVKDISEFLTTTGFILEMEVAEFLIKSGYEVEVSYYFHDYDEDKDREIDIIASKTINNTKIFFVIECKQSLVDDWIFVCSDKKPKRYFEYVKHLPRIAIKDIKDTKVFHEIHTLDRAIPLGQNYIIKDRSKKKSTSMQIDTCLEKIPKALVDLAYKDESEDQRILFLPIAVFSGQMFTAQYNKKLLVKKSEWVQYGSDLKSEGYEYRYQHNNFIFYPGLHDENKDKKEVKENSAVASTSQKLGSMYLIDFVTKRGLKKLISRVESDILKLKLESWPLPKKKSVESHIVNL